MIVELTGCSGAGKTTIGRILRAQLEAAGLAPCTPLEILIGRPCAARITWEPLQSLLLDAYLLPWIVQSAHIYRREIADLWRFLEGSRQTRLQRLLLRRSILRKLAVQIIADKTAWRKRLLLIDEGTTHIAHHVFARCDHAVQTCYASADALLMRM
jgi:hypothetical protein